VRAQFTTASSVCSLTSISIEPISGGMIADYQSSVGVVEINANSDPSTSTIQIDIPAQTVVEQTFAFRVKATIGLAEAFTDDILIT